MITYSKALSYARSISWAGYEDYAQDLLHDTFVNLCRRGIDLFAHSKRFAFVSIYNENLHHRVASMEGRHRVHFTDVSDAYKLSQSVDPLQLLITKELSETLSPELRLKVEGYSNKEIGEMVGRTGQAIGHRIKLQTEKLNGN